MLAALTLRLRRILAVAWVETLRLWRDPTTLSLVLAVPAIQLALFGYAVNPDPRNVPIAIAGDFGGASAAVRIVSAAGYFKIVGDRLAPGEAARQVRDGHALVGVELPPPADFDHPEAAARTRTLIFADAADPSAVRPALGALQTAFWRDAARQAKRGKDQAAPGGVDVQLLFNPDGRTAWSILPGLAGVVVMISTLMMGALTLVRERERGAWEGLLATPVDALDALVGKLSPYVVMGVAQTAIVLFAGRLLFAVPFHGPVGWLLALSAVYAAAHLLLGFAISATARSQLQAVQAAVFFYLPSMLLSGFMFPFQGMPRWAQAIGNALPLTHFVRAARGVLLKGQGLALVAHELVPIALFAGVAMAVALVAYGRRLT